MFLIRSRGWCHSRSRSKRCRCCSRRCLGSRFNLYSWVSVFHLIFDCKTTRETDLDLCWSLEEMIPFFPNKFSIFLHTQVEHNTNPSEGNEGRYATDETSFPLRSRETNWRENQNFSLAREKDRQEWFQNFSQETLSLNFFWQSWPTFPDNLKTWKTTTFSGIEASGM